MTADKARHLPSPELERFYERLAEEIDQLPEMQESLFLAKLCLALAHRVPDAEAVDEALREARAGLGGNGQGPSG